LAFAERLISTFEPSVASRARLEQQVQRARQRLTDPRYYLAVVGQFSAGKSTFINALLAAELFASHTLATTAAAVRVSYGDRLAVQVTFTDGSTWGAADRSAKRKWYKLGIARSDRDDSPDIAKLRKDLRKMDLIEALRLVTTVQSVAELVTSIEVKYPSPFLADGLVLIDTPGMDPGNNAGPQHAEVARREVTDADATVVVMTHDQILSQSLTRFLVNEIDKGVLARCAFVVTRADQADADEIADLYRSGNQRITRALRIPDPPVVWAAPIMVVRTLRDEARPADADMWVRHFGQTREWLRTLTAARRPAAVADTALRIIDDLLVGFDSELGTAIKALDRQRAELNTAAPSDMGEFLSGHVARSRQALENAERDALALLGSEASSACRLAGSAIQDLFSTASRSDIKSIVDKKLTPLVQARQNSLVAAARSATRDKIGGAFTQQSAQLATAFRAEYGKLQRINAAPIAALSAGSLAGTAGIGAGSFNSVTTLADQELTQKGIAVGGGAVGGALIGTMIFPGVGTVIGGILGGFLGSLFGKPIAQVRAEVTSQATDAARQALYQAESRLSSAISQEAQRAQTELSRQGRWYRDTYEKAVLAIREEQAARRAALQRRQGELVRARAEADQRRAAIATDRARLSVVRPADPSDLHGRTHG
jgi:predicted GTPase